MKLRLSLEYKLIFATIFFAVFIVQFQHHQLSDRVLHEMVFAKESRNRLLVDTVAPIIAVNLAFGLEEANRAYLEQISQKNGDIIRLELIAPSGKILYRFARSSEPQAAKNNLNFRSERIFDTLDGTLLATIEVSFGDEDYRALMRDFDALNIQTILIAVASLIALILVIRRMFSGLRRLRQSVEAYDPKRHNFTLERVKGSDEIGVIHNAIVGMVERIADFAKALDQANASLESKVIERTAALEEANAALEKLSMTDALTDLPNRRYFEERFDHLWQLAQRNRSALAMIICDIDHFKKFNDTYGHVMGDRVLRSVAEVLKSVLKRKSDMVARYGGEEFVLVLYGVDTTAAVALCENIQEALRAMRVEHQPISMSFGVALVYPYIGLDAQCLLQAADEVLYDAKEAGRDRIIVGECDQRIN
ncbi:MAG: GGDEF domain-containing protein [Campylobacterales bacterium]|nr:GGDEF domain-containing protein [Campylobacterales bacterium]